MTTDTTLTLYYAPRTRSLTALWLLEELGEPYTLNAFALHSGRHKEPDFLALNPMGKVPMVDHGGVPVSEVGAIAIYLTDQFPDAKLGPAIDDPRRAAFLRWCFFASAVMEPAFGEKVFKWTVPARSVAWGSFDQMVGVLENALQDSQWILGDQFSAADVLIANNLRFGLLFGMLPEDSALAGYVERCTAREAFVRAAEIEVREGERFPPPAE